MKTRDFFDNFFSTLGLKIIRQADALWFDTSLVMSRSILLLSSLGIMVMVISIFLCLYHVFVFVHLEGLWNKKGPQIQIDLHGFFNVVFENVYIVN